MATEEQITKLNSIVDALLGPDAPPPRSLRSVILRLDPSRPNIHQTKKAFLYELDVVETVFSNLYLVVRTLYPAGHERTDAHRLMVEMLGPAIEAAAYPMKLNFDLTKGRELALANLHETGFFVGSVRVLIAMLSVYRERLLELKNQEKLFWKLPHRAPNYYLRIIALRLARVYAKGKRQLPMHEGNPFGNFSSTDFGRALAEVFDVLGIKANEPSVADWAIKELASEAKNSMQDAADGISDLGEFEIY